MGIISVTLRIIAENIRAEPIERCPFLSCTTHPQIQLIVSGLVWQMNTHQNHRERGRERERWATTWQCTEIPLAT